MHLIILACLLVAAFADQQLPFYKDSSNNNNKAKEEVGFFPFNKPPVKDGLPLPLPKSWTKSNTVFSVRGEGFVFNATGKTCDDLDGAFDRYHKMIFNIPPSSSGSSNFKKRVVS